MKGFAGFGSRVFRLATVLFLTYTVSLAGQIDPYTWDFGQVKQGEVLLHKFTLKNESAQKLRITGVNTSCGYTVSEAKSRVLLPQESTEIEVKFNSKGYAGPVQQFVYVNTDSIDKPLIRFIIKADVAN
ncbi:MAG: DUF1573 domain-containing protein [Candidatus Omnitrophota bacterium]